MNSTREANAHSTAVDARSGPTTRWSYLRLFCIPGATLLIALIFYSLGHLNLSRPAQHLLNIFVYSACISLPCVSILPWLSSRFSRRFGRAIVLLQALALLLIAITGTLIAAFVVCGFGINSPGDYSREVRSSMPFSVVITLAIGMAVTSYETMRYKLQAAELETRTLQMEEERANKLLVEARLSSLESSIHPHFLFNTLNSIAALIPSDPRRAEELVGRLASLLRFSLNAHHSGLVPLSQELKIVRDYLEIEATRFGTRLRYKIRVPDTLNSIRVPAMSLQTLVENSIKHVAATRPEGVSIDVSASATSDRIMLEVRDDGPGFSIERIEPGHGLSNLTARLELLLGNAAGLEISCGEKTIVRLLLPAVS